jgi:hypothetical protein
MFDLKVEQPINPPELTEAEERALEQAAAKKEAWIEDTVAERMRDRDWVIDALISQVSDNLDTQYRLADLIMGHGDRSALIGNLKLDCMDWTRVMVEKEYNRGWYETD